MKIISDKIMKSSGLRRVTVELLPSEDIVAVNFDRFYKLGHPIGDVVAGHILSESMKVEWCSVSQDWIES